MKVLRMPFEQRVKHGGNVYECTYHVGWFMIECGGAICTLVLVYMSMRLRETVSDFRSRVGFSTAVTVHHVMSLGTLLI